MGHRSCAGKSVSAGDTEMKIMYLTSRYSWSSGSETGKESMTILCDSGCKGPMGPWAGVANSVAGSVQICFGESEKTSKWHRRWDLESKKCLPGGGICKSTGILGLAVSEKKLQARALGREVGDGPGGNWLDCGIWRMQSRGMTWPD